MNNPNHGIYEMPQNTKLAHVNDVHYSGGLFARIPHEFLKDVKDPVAIAVYNHLMMYADWNSGLAHPSRERLSKALDYKTTRPVDNAIKHLVAKGWIKTFPRWSKFDEETGRRFISYEPKDGFSQTANGYMVYDQKQQVDGQSEVDTGGLPTNQQGGDGSTPPPSTGVDTNKNHLNKNHLTTKKHMLISHEKSEHVSQPEESQEPKKQESPPSQKKTQAEKYPQDFLDWYAIYPRKKAKGDALKAYRQALKEIDYDELVEKTRKFARYVEQSQTPQQYVPYPASWLRAAQWDDEQDVPQPENAGGTGGRGDSALEIARRMIFEQGYGQDTAGQANANHRELNW